MKRFFALLLALLMLLSLAACGQSDDASQPTDPPEPSTEPKPTAAEAYTEAAQKIQAMTNAWLTIDLEKQTSVGNQSFSEVQELSMKMNGIGTEAFAADLSGIIEFGTEDTVVISEVFQSGTVYGDLDGYLYTAQVSAGDFIARYVPAVLLDASLYSTVEFVDETTISFSGASALEGWLAGEDCELIGAVGTATMDGSGALASTTYDVTYSCGSTVVTQIVTVEVADYTAQVEVPADVSGYTQLNHPDIPMLMQRSFGNLMQSRSVSSSINETIVSAGVEAVYAIQTTLDLYGQGMDMKAQADYTHQMTDLYGNSLWTTTVGEHYSDGEYIYTYDGESETYPVDSEATAEDLRLGFVNLLGDNAPLLSGLQSVTLTEVPGGYVLDYTFTEEFGEDLKSYASGMILSDPGYLDSLADGYTVQQSEGYMGIDAATCLPTAYSITYTGAHSIGGYEYVLSLQTSQTIDGASLNAYTAVTGEPLPATEQTESPKPLFYHVTGPDGEEMWLLGTIHVGDQRTSDLPREIYEAFAASDALAVEFDINAFTEQMETDPELAQTLASYFMYLDGSTVSSHIADAEVYEAAKQMLKFTGEYSATAEMMKPSLWSQSIENFYLRLGYKLTSDFGVDMQLLNLAQEQGKTILNVESGTQQLQMFAGYSDALQEYLLASSLSYTPAEYYTSVHELFELWCAGDEEALTEMLAPQDTSGMTDEERKLYEEYTKAMEWDRNAQMLEVAKGYLTGGDTVFYAVGLAHLLAEDGLVNTLRAAGYTVELVSYE